MTGFLFASFCFWCKLHDVFFSVYGLAGVGVLLFVRCCASCSPIPAFGVCVRMLMCLLLWFSVPGTLGVFLSF